MAIESSSVTTHSVYHACQEDFFNGLLAHAKVNVGTGQQLVVCTLCLASAICICSVLASIVLFILSANKKDLDLWTVWKPYASPYFVGVYLCLLMAILLVLLGGFAQRYSKARAIALAATGALLLLVSLTAAIGYYAEKVYPHIEAPIGGGYPEEVDIIVSPDARDVIKSLGIKADGDLLQGAHMLHESESSYYLMGTITSTGKIGTIRLPKNLVAAMRITSRYLRSSP